MFLKYLEILKSVEVGHANSQHEQIFVKYKCRVSSQILQTFRLIDVWSLGAGF